MKIILIFVWIYAAMIAMSFWESYTEGRHAWDKRKLGWKLRITKRFVLPAYHFYLFFVMWPLLLTLPFVIYGFDLKMFGIVMSAYFSGLVVEDFFWYVVNPVVKLSEFNSKFAKFYAWIKLGELEVPLLYIIGLSMAITSWYFIWR